MSKSIKSAKSVKVAAATGARFTLVTQFRPGSGTALASYTAAWLSLTGIATDTPIPAKTLRALAGDTAFSHHKKQGNFALTDKGVILTDAGFNHFCNVTPNRNVRPDSQMVEAYMQVLRTGKTNDLVKNPAGIKPL